MPTNPWLIVIAKETLPLRHFPNLRKIWSYFHQDSHSFSLHPLSRENFCAKKTPAYQTSHQRSSLVSVSCLSPVHLQGLNPWQVSCYAFFKGWLLLSLPPCCLRIKTPFVTLSMSLGTLTKVSLVRVLRRYLTHRRSFLFYTVSKFWVGKGSVA